MKKPIKKRAAALLRAVLWWGSENLGHMIKPAPRPEIQFIDSFETSYPRSVWAVSKNRVFCLAEIPKQRKIAVIPLFKLEEN